MREVKPGDTVYLKLASSRYKEADRSQNPIWQLRVNDTEPIYFYCSAYGSCDKQKMIGGINIVRC